MAFDRYYSIVYNTQYGEAPENVDVIISNVTGLYTFGSTELPVVTDPADECIFLGWSIDGQTVLKEGDEVNIEELADGEYVYLTAIWKEKKYKTPFLDKVGLTHLVGKIKEDLSSKVDKVDGKGLSTNDYTTTEKNKLAGIAAGAEVNTVDSVNSQTGAVVLDAADVGALPSTTVLADLTTDATHRTVTDAEKATWNAKSDFSGSYTDLTNKPTIPSVAGLATETYVDNAVEDKVDKVTGKGLSTNDYTTAEKTKLASVEVVSVTASDAGKFMVVDSTGKWSAQAMQNAEEVSF